MRLLWLRAWLAFAASTNPLIAGFIRFERDSFPNNDEPIVPHVEAPTATDMSTAVMKTFSSLGDNEQYSTGTGGLSGCTIMYIISRKGVYATHWWENMSFSPDEIWREPVTQTDRELFQSTVFNMLTSGGRFHPKLDAELIKEDGIQAYLIYPKRTFAKGAGDEIQTTVGRLVPTLQDQSRWTDMPGTHGKNLFKYDPARKLGGGQTQHLAMLWAENEKEAYHHDQW
ncbi:uncharacterized protein P174DRAFT_474596 [Aspergillus novofumigatus IBT 16806]|uniref:Uncharacterized protein n=1 Tax=Aspergillus novofumigatus (strain IBT 16806) TaxID=1392255 RepID=A0A2I1CFJ7_ASPN1|nr:uncharacterized protein P174DRAFT_474596 [Aspergillus novofumigatus IBT 16806]PKX96407.1 hypothetical protein P174DRAFT_474596 [Aspergillus novofumigatus IBT 16806]